MRASRPLTTLLAFAMAATLILTTSSAIAQPKQIPLPVTFNEVSKGDFAAVPVDDDVFLSPADLERLGLTGPMWRRLATFARLISGSRKEIEGQEFISLKALAPFLTFKFDQATLALSITAAPQLLAPTSLNVELGPPVDIIYSKDRSTFLNYSVSSRSGHHPTAFAESGTSFGGNLLLNSVSRTTTGDFVRQLSSYIIDERTRLRRWTLGDASATTDLLGGSVLIGGATVQRNFNLDPYFVRYPPLNLRGTALTPSRVEVYVNGALISQQDVPPGPFELRNLPVASGAGNARIVVRDVFGREQIANQPYYYSTGVLEKGLSEFVYSAGFIRQNFGSESFDYGSPALLAFHRQGFTDTLTAGGRFEASRNLVSGGPTASWRTRWGEFSAAVAGSDDHGHAGAAGTLGYQYLAHSVSFGGFARSLSRQYANVSMRREADRPLLDANLFVTFLVSPVNFTLLWNDTNMRDQASSNRVTLLSNLTLTRRASVFVSLGSANEGRGRRGEVFTGLSYFFGGTTSASITVDRREGRTQTVTEVDKAFPVGTGFGYRFQSALADGDRTGTAQLQYQTNFGRYEIGFDPYHTNLRPTITAAGGLVYQNGSLLTARPVQDSFALVRVPGVRDVRVYSSNNLVGRTDSNGDLLVPNLLAYYGNRLSIDDRDVPLNYDVQGTEKTIAPPYRGGAFVPFPVWQIRTVTGSVSIRGSKQEIVPTFGQLTLSANGKSYESPLGRGGEFYFENIGSGTYDAIIEYKGGTCRFRVDVPSGSDSIVKLGQQICEAAKP